MKKIWILLIAILGAVFLGTSSFNFEYLMAEIRYDAENKDSSKIIFSQNSGFYDEEFHLSIFAPTEEIYYTLDGSEPTKESYRYEGPIYIYDATQNENIYSMIIDVCGNYGSRYEVPDYHVDKCTILKAAYYDEWGNRSNTEERIYFVDYAEKPGYEDVNIISITTDPENLFGDEKGIYVLGDTFEAYAETDEIEEEEDYQWEANYKNYGREWEREANITFFNTEKELVLEQAAGIRIQGGVSRSFYPKSLSIFARSEYGNNKMYYDFFGTGYYPEKVTLSAGGNDVYGKMKDRIGAELSEELNFSTMNYVPCVLFLDGEYWGFYYLTEKYDENYIEHYYNVNKDNVMIYKLREREAGISGDDDYYEEMRDFIESADMKIEENYQRACELIDIDSFLDYYAAEIYMARSGDWPQANYEMWRSRAITEKPYEDGKWRWMLFDVNTAAFESNLLEHDTIAYAIEECDLFASLSKNPQFRKDFTERLRKMQEEVFTIEKVNERLEEYKALMSDPMENHMQRFFGSNNDMYHTVRREMRVFASFRPEYIETMLENNGF